VSVPLSAGRPKLLVVQHVPWEGPHRILDACGDLEVETVMPLAGERLPDHDEVAAAVVMGGPMNAGDHAAYPGLALEKDWLAEALRLGMPLLGVCLGAQLIARALGAEVRPGPAPEIGFAPVEVRDPTDPLVGRLAPRTPVLHWHGDVFELPEDAVSLASSDLTEHQAFRRGSAWGLLFHAEADARLVQAWLAVPEMAAEAASALGPDAGSQLATQAAEEEAELIRRSTPAFQAFADLAATVD
jgi:GMP synthase (glutamine-hydrolysing)